MTRHELASFALKLLGIYALIKSLPLIQLLGGALGALASAQGRDMSGFWPIVGMFIPMVLMAVVGMLLIAFSKDLAPRLVGEDKPLGIASTLSGQDVQAIGFSVVAVLIFLDAIPRFVQGIASWQTLSQLPSGSISRQVIWGIWQTFVSSGIQLILAAVLFLWPRGIANLWHRIQAGKYVRIDEARP